MSAISKITLHQQKATLTSNWISRLFWSGHAQGGIQKMRSIFFERAKSSGVPVTQPAGCGGEYLNHKRTCQYIEG